jgi:alkaline phosphatase
VDVNLYAKGDGTEVLRGSHENTEIGDFIVDYLGLDLASVTEKLEDLSVESGERLMESMKVTSYHH